MVLFASSTRILGEVGPPRVGVGVVERGGLARLDIGDVARDTILDPGTEAEKNFLDDPNMALKGLGILSSRHFVLPFGIGATRLLLNSSFLFLLYLPSDCLNYSIEENLASCARDLESNIPSLSINSLGP